jgi:hypothetical protein
VHAVQVRKPTGPLDLTDAFYWRPFVFEYYDPGDYVDSPEEDPLIFMPAALNVSDIEEVAEIIDGVLASIEEALLSNVFPTTCEFLTLCCWLNPLQPCTYTGVTVHIRSLSSG